MQRLRLECASVSPAWRPPGADFGRLPSLVVGEAAPPVLEELALVYEAQGREPERTRVERELAALQESQ